MTFFLRFSLLLSSIILYNLRISAQDFKNSSLYGKVEDTNGRNISHATVQLLPTNKIVHTDEQGQFVFNNLASGNYQLLITSLEIDTLFTVITILEGINRQNFKVSLQRMEAIEEVFIERKSIKQEIELSGFAAKVIETKVAALRNVQVNELLDQTVGIRIRQNGGLGAQVDYNINGMSGNAIGIFIDGINAATYGSSFNLSNIPPAMIDRIEVYKGVLPTHLSGDLLGGAINVVLKKEAINNLSASVSYGSFNTLQSQLNGIYRSNNGLSLRGAAFYSYSDNDYEIWGRFARNTLPDGTMEETRAKRFFDAYKSYGGRIETGFTQTKWADDLIIGYNGSYTYNEIQHGLYMTQPYMGRFTESNANVFTLNYVKSNILLNGLDLAFNGVVSNRNQYVQDTVSSNYNWSGQPMIGFHGKPIKTSGGAQQGAPTMNEISRRIGTFRINLNYLFSPQHQFSLNYALTTTDRNDFDKIRHVAEQLYRSKNQLWKQVSSANYETQWFNRRLRTNLFGKWYQQTINRKEPIIQSDNSQSTIDFNYSSTYLQTLGYGFTISYTPLSNFHFLASAERAIRLPNEAELFGEAEENIIANPNLRPEISNNLNLGFRYQFYLNEINTFSFGMTGFARNSRDKIVRRAEDRLVNEAVQTMPFENLGLAQSVGFEGEINYDFNRIFQLHLNLSKFNSLFKQEFDSNSGVRLDRYNKQLPNEPYFTINGQVHYYWKEALQKGAGLNLNYGVGYVAPYQTIWIKTKNTTTPPQYAHDFGASYRFPNQQIVLSFDVKNVFNAALYDNFAVQKPGRSLYLKLNYTINKF